MNALTRDLDDAFFYIQLKITPARAKRSKKDEETSFWKQNVVIIAKKSDKYKKDIK